MRAEYGSGIWRQIFRHVRLTTGPGLTVRPGLDSILRFLGALAFEAGFDPDRQQL